MKKKVLALLLAISLVCGTAFASGPLLFKGFKIANIVVGGKSISSDVPAIVMDGRVMVPLRSVTEALGASVSWDIKTSTAMLTPAKSSNADVTDHVIAMDLYSRLDNLAEMIYSLDQTILLVTRMPNAEKSDLEHVVDRFEQVKSFMKSDFDYLDATNLELSKSNVDISDAYTIKSKCIDAIKLHESAFLSYLDTDLAGLPLSESKFWNNLTLASDTLLDARSIASKKFAHHRNQALNE